MPLAEARDAAGAGAGAAARRAIGCPTWPTRLDDELAAGTALKEAASAVGLETVSVPAVDPTRQGPPTASRSQALPPWPEFLQVALETAAGETSLLEETDAGGYFVVHVDTVVEPRLKPVDEVRDAAGRGLAGGAAARARAAEGRAAARPPDGRRRARRAARREPASRASRSSRSSGMRPATDQGINRAVVRALFATEPGEVAEDVIELGDGFAVVAHRRGDRGRSGGRSGWRSSSCAAELEGDMRTDLLAQFEAAAAARLSGRDRRRGDQPPDRRGRAQRRAAPAGPLPERRRPEPMTAQPDLGRVRRSATRPASPRWSGPRWSPTWRRRSRPCSSWPRAGPTASCWNRSRAARCAAATRRSASSPT